MWKMAAPWMKGARSRARRRRKSRRPRKHRRRRRRRNTSEKSEKDEVGRKCSPFILHRLSGFFTSVRLSFRIGGTAGGEGGGEPCSTMRNPPPRSKSFYVVRGFLSVLHRSPHPSPSALPPGL